MSQAQIFPMSICIIWNELGKFVKRDSVSLYNAAPFPWSEVGQMLGPVVTNIKMLDQFNSLQSSNTSAAMMLESCLPCSGGLSLRLLQPAIDNTSLETRLVN